MATPILDVKGKSIEKEVILHNNNKIVVFVENEDDVPFWKQVFGQFNLKTKITPNTNQDGQDDLKRGKSNLFRFVEQLHKNFVLCMDSDYDYLLNGATKTSKTILENPFIFHTYTYSYENYKCYAPSLHQVLVEASLNDNELFDYEVFMKEYSKTIYDLFLYSVYYERIYKIENEQYTSEYIIQKDKLTASALEEWKETNALGNHQFPIIDGFCEQIKIRKQFWSETESREILAEMKNKIDECVASLNEIKEADKKVLQDELTHLGLMPENTYLFIQGHTVKKNVVLMFLNPIFDFLKDEKIAEIKLFSGTQKGNKISEYQNQQTKVTNSLHANQNFQNCFLFKKILADVGTFASTHHPK